VKEKCGANKRFSLRLGNTGGRMAWKLLPNEGVMNSAHLPVSENAARRVNKAKRKPRGRPRTAARKTGASGVPDLPSAGTLARTKTLLLAALRVWELKHRVSE
jgi:hypothetical protein